MTVAAGRMVFHSTGTCRHVKNCFDIRRTAGGLQSDKEAILKQEVAGENLVKRMPAESYIR